MIKYLLVFAKEKSLSWFALMSKSASNTALLKWHINNFVIHGHHWSEYCQKWVKENHYFCVIPKDLLVKQCHVI